MKLDPKAILKDINNTVEVQQRPPIFEFQSLRTRS